MTSSIRPLVQPVNRELVTFLIHFSFNDRSDFENIAHYQT